MTAFSERMEACTNPADGSMDGRRIVLACDYGDAIGGDAPPASVAARVMRDTKAASPYVCAIKLNFHLLLPLGTRHIARIMRVAHRCGLQAIADIKLNDIGNTNRIATDALWDMGFDAVIANPIMGPKSLDALVKSAHGRGKGVITLCHMSAPEARASYEMRAYPTSRSKDVLHIHEIFLDWALRSGADGIIVGATFPNIIRECSARIRQSTRGRRGPQTPLIISPGVGAQGADAAHTISAGSDYVIAGRSIIESGDVARAARLLYESIS